MAQPKWTLTLSSEQDTHHLGKAIGRLLEGGETLALMGELGAGKTSLVRGIASGSGFSPEKVSSPTFTLIQEYRARILLAHVDLYRIHLTQDLDQLGLSDYFDGHTTVIIEWADRAGGQLPNDHLIVHLHHHTQHSRTATLQPTGPVSDKLFTQLTQSFVPCPPFH